MGTTRFAPWSASWSSLPDIEYIRAEIEHMRGQVQRTDSCPWWVDKIIYALAFMQGKGVEIPPAKEGRVEILSAYLGSRHCFGRGPGHQGTARNAAPVTDLISPTPPILTGIGTLAWHRASVRRRLPTPL